MTESQHTPGPWHYRPEKHDDWGYVRAASPDSLPGELVARAHRHNYLDDDVLDEHRRKGTDPSEADARLIAAAPEMLAALHEARAALDKPEIYANHPVGSARIAILTAIEKAEGRA